MSLLDVRTVLNIISNGGIDPEDVEKHGYKSEWSKAIAYIAMGESGMVCRIIDDMIHSSNTSEDGMDDITNSLCCLLLLRPKYNKTITLRLLRVYFDIRSEKVSLHRALKNHPHYISDNSKKWIGLLITDLESGFYFNTIEWGIDAIGTSYPFWARDHFREKGTKYDNELHRTRLRTMNDNLLTDLRKIQSELK